MAAEVAINLVFRVSKFLLTGWRAEREQSAS
jgi:hypothetical protein